MPAPDPAIRASLREAFTDLSPPATVRAQLASEKGWDTGVWRRLCGELGLAGIGVPERYGGAGLSMAEVAVACEEAGRALLSAPLFSTVAMALPLLLGLGDEAACRRYLPGICAGTLTATIALADDQGRYNSRPMPITAMSRAGEWRLDGTCNYVIHGSTADIVLVPANAAGQAAVFTVEAGASGLHAEALMTLDLTRRQARLRFDGTPARRIGRTDAGEAVAAATDVARALLAAECVGGAQRCLDMTVGYTKTRIQFGRPIGSFQAVKQKAADMLIRVESARSAADAAAAAAAASGQGDLPVVAAVAKAYCADTFMSVAADTIQLHGGIGFTWEHDAQLYFKRARSNQELLGNSTEHLERIGDYLGTHELA